MCVVVESVHGSPCGGGGDVFVTFMGKELTHVERSTMR